MVIDGLGLQREAVIDLIKTKRPTYPQFEAWIKSQPGVKIDKESVDKLNRAVRGYNHADETRQSILGASGITNDAQAPRDAVSLNNLDDWQEIHEAALK